MLLKRTNKRQEVMSNKSQWKSSVYDLGEIKAGTTNAAEFDYVGNKTIRNIHPSCGCTNAQFNPATKKLSVSYKNSTNSGVNISKHINVSYTDGTYETLNIKAVTT